MALSFACGSHAGGKFFTGCGPLSFACGSHAGGKFFPGCGPLSMGLKEGFLRQPRASPRAAPARSMGMN